MSSGVVLSIKGLKQAVNFCEPRTLKVPMPLSTLYEPVHESGGRPLGS